VPTTTTTVSQATETTHPADIPPEVARVFEEMDRAFADSKSRSVVIRTRIEMMSAIRGYRAQVVLDMKLQFPNLMDIRMTEAGEVNDRATTTAWTRIESPRAGMLCDGKKILMMKGFMLTQDAPASLDAVLDEQVEIGAWGDNAIASCFLKTRPSDAFKKDLKRARLLQYTPEQIDLELVTAAPRSIREKNNIPWSFDLVQHVILDGRTMIPRRCHIDHKELAREIYRRGDPPKDVAIENALTDIVVASVDLKANFAGQEIFVMPKDLSGGKKAGLPRTTTGDTTEPAKQ
jgi:hypothetical protein